MGCDIHLYIEKKGVNGWEELPIAEELIPDERDYEVFSFLAGVRGNNGEHFADRGIPEDSSIPTGDDDFWLGDHSYTYAYLDEILSAPWEEAGLQWRYFPIFCEYVLPRLDTRFGWYGDEEKRDIRILMGFDS